MRLHLSARTRTSMAAAAVVLLLGILCPLPGAGRAYADEGARQRLLAQVTRLLKEAERGRKDDRHSETLSSARRALGLLEQADRLGPGAADTAFLGVQAAVFAGDRAAAGLWVARLGQRSAYGDKDPNVHYAHALIWLLLENRPHDAVVSLDRMAAASRSGMSRVGNVLLHDSLTANARRLLDRARVFEAVAAFKRAAQVARRLGDPRKERTARANGAVALLAFGHAEDAEKLFASLRRDDAANPLWAWNLAQCLTLQERYEEAGPLYTEVARVVDQGTLPARHAPMLRRAYLELGRTWREAAKRDATAAGRAAALEKARVSFDRFIRLSPTVSEGWFRLGRLLYEDLDAPYAAIDKLEKAYVLEPVCDRALRLLIRIASRYGPRSVNGEAPDRDAVEEWNLRRADWEKALEAHGDAWEAERLRRRESSPRGWDGCPR